jgi:hypothetical protein
LPEVCQSQRGKDGYCRDQKKYGKQNISTLGHSQGSVLSRKLGKGTKEIINVNPAYTGEKPQKNEYNIRSSSDVVSGLYAPVAKIRSVFSPKYAKKHDVTIPTKSSLDVLGEHSYNILDRLGEKEIGVGAGRRLKSLGYSLDSIDWVGGAVGTPYKNVGYNPIGVIGGAQLTPNQTRARREYTRLTPNQIRARRQQIILRRDFFQNLLNANDPEDFIERVNQVPEYRRIFDNAFNSRMIDEERENAETDYEDERTDEQIRIWERSRRNEMTENALMNAADDTMRRIQEDSQRFERAAEAFESQVTEIAEENVNRETVGGARPTDAEIQTRRMKGGADYPADLGFLEDLENEDFLDLAPEDIPAPAHHIPVPPPPPNLELEPEPEPEPPATREKGAGLSMSRQRRVRPEPGPPTRQEIQNLVLLIRDIDREIRDILETPLAELPDPNYLNTMIAFRNRTEVLLSRLGVEIDDPTAPSTPEPSPPATGRGLSASKPKQVESRVAPIDSETLQRMVSELDESINQSINSSIDEIPDFTELSRMVARRNNAVKILAQRGIKPRGRGRVGGKYDRSRPRQTIPLRDRPGRTPRPPTPPPPTPPVPQQVPPPPAPPAFPQINFNELSDDDLLRTFQALQTQLAGQNPERLEETLRNLQGRGRKKKGGGAGASTQRQNLQRERTQLLRQLAVIRTRQNHLRQMLTNTNEMREYGLDPVRFQSLIGELNVSKQPIINRIYELDELLGIDNTDIDYSPEDEVRVEGAGRMKGGAGKKKYNTEEERRAARLDSKRRYNAKYKPTETTRAKISDSKRRYNASDRGKAVLQKYNDSDKGKKGRSRRNRKYYITKLKLKNLGITPEDEAELQEAMEELQQEEQEQQEHQELLEGLEDFYDQLSSSEDEDDPSNPPSGQLLTASGRKKKQIDFGKIKWNSFTRMFHEFKKENPKARVKDLEAFAKRIIKNKSKFSDKAFKKAQFYLNIIKKD